MALSVRNTVTSKPERNFIKPIESYEQWIKIIDQIITPYNGVLKLR